MSTPRRQVLRTVPAAVANDLRRAQQLQKRRSQLEKEQLALDRWLKRLKRACDAVQKQQQRISRLMRRIRQADQA